MHSLEFILVLAFHIQAVLTLTCYWCSGVDNDRMCETKPRKVTSYPVAINCSTKFCVSTKVMDAVTGNVRSFARSCDHIPRGNQCVKDIHFVTCYETCTFDLCNSGNLDPSYLPTRSHSGVLLQPSEVFGVEDTPPKIFNSKKFYKQLSEKPEGWKSGFHVNKTLNSGNYLSKLDPERVKRWKEPSGDFNSPPEAKINGFHSFENSEISNYSSKKLIGVTDKGSNSRNDSFIQSYPFSSFAEKDKDLTFSNGDEKIPFFSNQKIPEQEILWWEKAKDTPIDANNVVDIVQAKSINNIDESYKDARKDIKHENSQAVSLLPTGDKQDEIKSVKNFSDYFPLILKDVSGAVTSMTPSSTEQHEKTLKYRDTLLKYASPVTSITQSSLVRWWEKSDPRPENDQAGDVTVHHPWELPDNGIEQVTTSMEPARSGDVRLGDSSNQFVKPWPDSRQAEISRGGSQGFMSVSERAKPEVDERTNWQQTLPGSDNVAHGQGMQHGQLGKRTANTTFLNEPELDAGTAVIQPSEPFRASLGNLCRPVTCLSVETGNHTSFNFTANYGFSTGYTQLRNFLNTSTNSPRKAEFTADSAPNLKNELVRVSSNSKVNNSLVQRDTSGQDIFPASHYLEFTVVKDDVTGRPDSALVDTVSSPQDGRAKVIQSALPDLAESNSVASAQKFPAGSTMNDTSETQSRHGRPQINRNGAASTQQSQRHLEASIHSVASAERTHSQEEHTQTTNFSISQQHSNETRQGFPTVDKREDGDSLDKLPFPDPDVSIKRTNAHGDHEKRAHLSIKEQQQLTEISQDTGPAGKLEGGNPVDKESFIHPHVEIPSKHEKQAKAAHLAITEQTFPDRSNEKEPAGKTEDGNNLHNQSFLHSDIRITPAHFHKHGNRTKYFSVSHQVSANVSQDVQLPGKIEHQSRLDNEPSLHVGISSTSTLMQEENSRTINFSITETSSTEGMQDMKSSKTEDRHGLDNGGNKSSFDKPIFNKFGDDKHNQDKLRIGISSNGTFIDDKLSYDNASHGKAINERHNASYDKARHEIARNDKHKPSYDKASHEIAINDKHNASYDRASHEIASDDKHGYFNTIYDKSKDFNIGNKQSNDTESNVNKSTFNKSSNLISDCDKPGVNKPNCKTQHENLSRDKVNKKNNENNPSSNNLKYKDSDAIIIQADRPVNNVNRSSEGQLFDVRDMPDGKNNANAQWVDQENIQKQFKNSLSQIRMETKPNEAEKFTNRSKNLWISNFTTSDHATSKVQTRIVANTEKTGKKVDTNWHEIGHRIDLSQGDNDKIINITLARETDARKAKRDKQEADFSRLHSLTTRWDIKTQTKTMISTVEVESTVNKSTLVKERISENTVRENVLTDDGLREITNKHSHNIVEEGNNQSNAHKPATRSQKITSIKQVFNLTDVIPEPFIEGKLDKEADTKSMTNKKVVAFINKKQFKKPLLSEKQHPNDPNKQKFSRLPESSEKLDLHSGGKRTNPNKKKHKGNEKHIHEKKRVRTNGNKPATKVSGNNVLETTNAHRNATRPSTRNYLNSKDMAAKNQSARSQARMPRQRIYLRRNLPGRNEKLQSETKIFMLNKNSSSRRFEIVSVVWLTFLLIFSMISK